ncbi:asparagine synthase-related protein [Actinokineospora bangkokensis]|uniref:asparagine synthase-related protein n=1 Tax=Actinokineospora bangkokensis TaxID=1193682 RepID=UPI0011786545|nr:asparagine synthase-related protein [Actinokineospora bangkokensis]
MGGTRVVVLGSTSTTPAEVADAARRITAPADLDRWAATIPGCVHLLASIHGRTRAQGSVVGVRRVFHAVVDGATVAADRARPLADLLGAGLDPDSVALHLLLPAPPWPLHRTPLWKGVSEVPGDSHLDIAPDGAARVRRWWQVPAADTPMAVAAPRVFGALADAVRARTSPGTRVSTDLSGGMDSTSLAFLAAPRVDSLLTTRYAAADPTADDPLWAGRAAAELPGARHLVFERPDVPDNFTDALAPGPSREAPFPWIRARAVIGHQLGALAGRGITDHLSGYGGDELFTVPPAVDHSTLRTAPWRYLGVFRGNRAVRRQPLVAAAASLVDNRGHATWLRHMAEVVGGTRPWSQSRDGWGELVRLPWWSTGHAVRTVRDLLARASVEDAEPSSRWRAQHAVLSVAEQTGRTIGDLDGVAADRGVRWHAPFLDDRVLEAALAVRFADRVDANAYKPVLAAAMRGTVPDDILDRGTKAEFSADLFAGMRTNRDRIVAECEDMVLARIGLIDAAEFRAELVDLHVDAVRLQDLLTTLACEAWLRTTTDHAPLKTGGTR